MGGFVGMPGAAALHVDLYQRNAFASVAVIRVRVLPSHWRMTTTT